MLDLLIMRQGKQEIDDSFNKHFYVNLQTLYLEGGRHILQSKYIVGNLGDKLTDEDLKNYEEKFKGGCLLKRSDVICYGSIL